MKMTMMMDGKDFWSLDLSDIMGKQKPMSSQARYSISSCFCNLSRCEKNSPQPTELQMAEDSQVVDMAVLVLGILLGFVGFVAGVVIIIMSKLEPRAV
ncbi:uncharacterized protein si:ch73-31d8.2 [Danio aesculapii]|uniref:uncharacterized protein si:ch73-31d8.2 n=1 Tax=Danio aesculapii TaxID=1142201 RepID=UPI0024C0A753|nr:uncharacterized protein si:ch73-31d8.2 [Danio aesculapii]